LALSTALSHALIAFTVELDNEFERRLGESGHAPRVTSLVMWSNFMRFIGDGITVAELPTASGIPRARTLSTLGGMERWRYVTVDPDLDPAAKRDGYGSARGLRPEWVVRLTGAGHAAEAIWRPLPAEIEERWRERFGAGAIDELRLSLEATVGQLDTALPEYMPIVGGASWRAADAVTFDERERSGRLPLYALLSQVLLGYTLDFERESELALPLSANVVRVLDEAGVSVKELPVRAGVSKEAVAMALTSLKKTGHVVVEAKTVRLTAAGREAEEDAPQLHAEVEAAWDGATSVSRLRAALAAVLDRPDVLARGLRPHPGGWRGTKSYLAQTEAVLEDPTAALPRYPMVLHRGGWPDGS
jgi:hypothetical protein